jgi:hypothetical protein
MPETPNRERDALSRITGAFQRIQDKRAAQNAAPAAATSPNSGPPPALNATLRPPSR